MSFSAVASYASDKGANPFGQSCEDLGADFFDQFLTFDSIDNGGPDYLQLADSTHLELSEHHHGIGGAFSSWTESEGKDSDVQESSWHWALGQKPSTSLHSSDNFYSELSGRAAISDSELLSLENISLGSPLSALSPQPRAHSLPSATTPNATISRRRNRIAESIPKIFRKAVSFDRSLRSPIKKTLKMRSSQVFQGNSDLTSKFQYEFERPMVPLSPPQSARVSDASDVSAAQFANGNDDDVFAYNNGLPQFTHRQTDYHTPLATPVLDGEDSRKTSGQQFSDNRTFPPTPQFHQAAGNWSQIPGSSEFSSFGTPSIQTSEIEAPVWWNHASTAPMAQPSPTQLHINPQRASRSLASQLQNVLPFESNPKVPMGLMISMPETEEQSFVITSPNMQSPHMSQQSYFGQSQAAHHQYPPPSRGYMPSHGQQSSPMHISRHTNRETESPSPKTTSSAFHVRKSRKPKSSAKTPRSPNGGGVDFVNFTPSDSRKILTGVAPSGSSKTKARREKEANDKRRKLSMAALRAVRAAGGDVESLVEQGLFA